MPDTFSGRMTSGFPESFKLDPILVQTMNWMEGQGWVRVHRDSDDNQTELEDDETLNLSDTPRYFLDIYPPDEIAFHRSNVHFLGASPEYETPLIALKSNSGARLVEIASVGGSSVAIWLDDAGLQKFVLVGHDANGTITDDPLVLLQFLAMGYPDPGALLRTDITPAAQFKELGDQDSLVALGVVSGEFVEPFALQKFLNGEYSVTFPATARELGISDFTHFGDAMSTDPFLQWMTRNSPPLSDEERQLMIDMADLMKPYGGGGFDPDNPPMAFLVSRFLGLFGPNE